MTAGPLEAFRVEATNPGEEGVEEDAENPGCYVLEIDLKDVNINKVADRIQAQPERAGSRSRRRTMFFR